MTGCWAYRLTIAATIAWVIPSELFPAEQIFVEASPLWSPLNSKVSKVPLAFAAGGGFGGGGASKNKKAKKGKNSKKGSLLSEVKVAAPPPTPEPNEKSDSQGPKVDKWGLPIPTTDDIFPPMPPGTELIAVDREKDDFSLSDISATLKDHIELSNLQIRFDENGVEKKVQPGRKAMKLKLLHQSPPVLAVENFFTKEECKEVQQIALSSEEQPKGSSGGPVQVQSATFSALAQSKRTSTSWFCYYSQVPVLLAKAYHVLGIPTLEQMEEPQIVRYKTGQEFSWHYDEVPSNQLKNGGQRLATLLVYLNDVAEGGGTVFRDLKDGATGEILTMKPKEGSALLFFPAFRDHGKPDDRTLHKGEVAGDEKWIIQMWIHESHYVATIPEGNLQAAAKQQVETVSAELGYI